VTLGQQQPLFEQHSLFFSVQTSFAFTHAACAAPRHSLPALILVRSRFKNSLTINRIKDYESHSMMVMWRLCSQRFVIPHHISTILATCT
jgi:hypothetical protein